MSRTKGAVRTSQLITTYGVGSMVALSDESFVIAGLDLWPQRDSDEIHEPRLERVLGVNRFFRPPSSERREDVPVARFPTWYSCPSCNRLDQWRQFGTPFGEKATCPFCDDSPELVPSRFVVACDHSHLDDFPYFRWVHQDQLHPKSDERAKLFIASKGATSGLRDIEIRCGCGARRSMEGAFSKTALQKFGTCSGLRPWLPDDKPKSCNADRRVLQRGATNVWFSITRSALSIPPWSERAFRALDRHWTIVRAVPPDILPLVLNNLNLGDDEFSVEDLVAAVLERLRDDEATAAKASIEEEEYEALIRNRPERHRDQTFVCVPAKDVDPSLHQWLPLVQQVRRLRLVQALTGFTRLRSDNGATERVGALTETAVDWLPAIEINGEGVFLQLEGEALTEWEHRPTVVRRVATLAGRYAESCLRLGAPLAVAVTPRLVLAHSIAHALIDQWSLEAGYPTAALSERLYVGDRMAGILIYTATSDSAGSLGGLVSMTEQSRLETSLAEALDRASWCGQDPLCIESDSHGVDALNLAACHSCLLVPETCCTHANTFLDRALLVGTDEEPELAYFRAMIGR